LIQLLKISLAERTAKQNLKKIEFEKRRKKKERRKERKGKFVLGLLSNKLIKFQ
jgi:hypothetical protein